MSRGRLALLMVAVTCVIVALPISFAGGHKKPAEKRLIAPLSGSEETAAADEDGYGAASIRIVGNKVCYTVSARLIDDVVGGHIHKAPAGENGDIVVGLFEAADLDPSRSACVRTARSIAKDIARNPADYYVNVHTSTFPNGAIRGQLTK